ncbi:hypothetical protein [Herbiconiux sp.]|uniref:hypothetical protein n=1 Tax=Herbiconiux sp. TaxID=1871186 RepID=UPI0025BBEB4B|nr:hypothetical protein [Herbiconiux sp.]
MRLRLALTISLTRSPRNNPEPPQFEHRDVDSMVIHEDQPKFIGFRRVEEEPGDE